ncbi:MAG: hypothetical protein ABJA57_00290 [Ginsengibacter sp.]
MDEQLQSLQQLHHIRQMMDRSSRFTSLSSLSGIFAGICGLAGAWVASQKLNCWQQGDCSFGNSAKENLYGLQYYLVGVALCTFAAAMIISFIFTFMKSKKAGLSLWRSTSFRVFWHIAIPFMAGGFFLARCIQAGYYDMLVPVCLVFYGLALISAGKFTLTEVRYLGYCEVLLGIFCLWLPGFDLYFWAAGFGILHILYGLVLWFRNERIAHPVSTRITV